MMLSDFNFTATTAIDDSFQFIDCSEVDFDVLAKDIHAGVLQIQHSKIIIAVGNVATMDNFTNVVHPVMGIINALIERYGCLHTRIWVVNVLPCPGVSEEVTAVVPMQNRGLARAVNALVRKKAYPLMHLRSHK